MKRSITGSFCVGLVLIGAVSSADADLLSRQGGAAFYDTDRDISWISNANLAASNTFGLSTGVSLGAYPSDTSGVNGVINADGTMNWPGALFWVDEMNASSYLGSSSWRLPDILDPDANCTDDTAGTTSSVDAIGFHCTGSDLPDLFYNALGASAGASILDGDPVELAKFTGIQGVGRYWAGDESSITNAWLLKFSNGVQTQGNKNTLTNYTWAVVDGDVGELVPPPVVNQAPLASLPALIVMFIGLFGSGLIVLLGVAKRK